MKRFIAASFVSICFWGAGLSLGAQEAVAPSEITGTAVYVPFPVSIVLDGSLDDWKGIPVQTVDRGPMKSRDSAEDGSFSFAVAADETNFYVLMLAKDKNIIAGAHRADTWNEDSMEFYVNLSGDLGSKKYLRDIAQYRVTPLDIGNTDLSRINVSGNNFTVRPLRARVFKTADGWGFEGAIALGPKDAPSHGKEIGFQAQLNGASTKDRNVKLIWSLADTGDNSWQNPSLFGRALFFKVGSTDVPQPSRLVLQTQKPAPAAPVQPLVAINQLGYFPYGKKVASVPVLSREPLPWSLVDATSGKEVARGTTEPRPFDPVSGDAPQAADFSSFTVSGSYYIVIGDRQSPTFRIGNDMLSGLEKDALKFFYRSRSGIAITPEYAGAAWAREAGHLTDAQVAVFAGKDAQGKSWDAYGFLVNGRGGWYDAGDFGKYVVNGGISVWTLQNAYERAPASFTDGQLGIPESGNGVPDILDEARWELEFMLNMQIPAGQKLAGMCFQKLHDRTWSAVPSALISEMDNNITGKDGWSWGRFVYEPTTAATLNLAAVAAQAARLWASLDAPFAQRCLTAARAAWKAARENPGLLAGNVPGDGGGNYLDADVSDEFFWAAAELLATTGERDYLDWLSSSPYWKAVPGLDGGKPHAMDWSDTAALGAISLISAPQAKIAASDRALLTTQIVRAADRYLAIAGKSAYGAPIDADGYVWGSNGNILNNAIVLAIAFDVTKKPVYRDGVVRSMDYLLGDNALRRSFVTGYGAYAAAHPHHRLWANDPEAGYPAPPPGILTGGPDKNIEDPETSAAGFSSTPIAQRYLDVLGSFSTNEVAINWNAPLVWVADWLNRTAGESEPHA